MIIRTGYLALTALALVLAACGSAAKALDVPTWAARTCEAEQRFTETIAASRDSLDPQALELDERKQRAERLGRTEIDAAKRLGEELRAIKPPEEARKYHEALVAHTDELVEAVEEQVDAIKNATAAQQIGVANASARFRLDGSQRELTARASELPDAVVQALTDAPACGAVPIPGETPPAVPTPSA